MLPAVTATRYVTPLREGGSLPGLMEADDLGTYVVKWRAAGQGVKVLAAEVVCGELARRLSLPVPALVTVDVAPELAVGEPDQEVQELLQPADVAAAVRWVVGTPGHVCPVEVELQPQRTPGRDR